VFFKVCFAETISRKNEMTTNCNLFERTTESMKVRRSIADHGKELPDAKGLLL
jgi:hypothetical protein